MNVIYAVAYVATRRVTTLGPRVLISDAHYPGAAVDDRLVRAGLAGHAYPLCIETAQSQNIIR